MSRLSDPQLARVLEREHAAARAQGMARRAAREAADVNAVSPPLAAPDFRVSEMHRTGYLAVGPAQGRWLYGMALAANAREIVEFGTSFGISTLYLAAAAAETGGRVTGTEFHADKAEKARANLVEAGLSATILTGDARETLAGPGAEIDLLFLDGAKELYLPILKLLAPRLRRGSMIVTDNIPTSPQEREAAPSAPFTAFLDDPANGFVATVIAFNKGGMSFAVKL